ncbi:hypothetical protein CO731_04715 [Aminobacter sp. MSH1]|uniref:hypothetical protein n=1 Tax=Aminobacter sp. MSH1 TaxID=374606 RepID=UPI000D35FA88|nr:hypothetical protein [Aminobacter sp. MSH1]AWC25221.1 hypothetical protein CO731_04715 [Aminobacter sp. MSH1]
MHDSSTLRAAHKESFKEHLKESKKWGDFCSIVSTFLVIGLMTMTAYLGQSEHVELATQVGMYLTMVGVIIVICIWQAAAVVAAAVRVSQSRNDM